MDGAFQPPLHLLARTRTAAPVTVVPEPARHYARVMVEPGMARAGKPLTNRQRAALDALDEVLADDSLAFTHRLQRGEMLVIDNVATVHGRTAFTMARRRARSACCSGCGCGGATTRSVMTR